jgi:uncharacterized tellurite resistance protein B-like protein
MFESVRRLIVEFGNDAPEAGRFDDNDYRLAAAALLVHAAKIDGAMSPSERQKLHETVKQRFALDDADTEALIAEATAAEREAIDLFKFTARLNRALDEKGRARIVEMMWQIAYADGKAGEFEDNLIWRASDLLHVPRRERIALRDRVAGTQ